jgi:hypothetical protein
VSSTPGRRPGRRSPLTHLVASAAVLGLVVTGCSSPDDEPTADSTAESSASGEASSDESPTDEASASQDTPTESPTADVPVPDGVEVTAQGSDLEFGDTATVVFEPNQKKSTLLDLTVKNARKGRLSDFEGFILDDDYKRKANYFYVKVAVENVGDKNVGGSPVPLWGVNEENTLLPAVNFTTAFKPCASTPLPKKFKSGDSVDTCLVYLAPNKGSLESLSFRPDQAFDPIEWTGEVKPPKKDKKKRSNNNGGGSGGNS